MLRPQRLETEGLLTALTRCAGRLVEGGSVQVVATSSGDIRLLPLRIADTLYRIGQEALANAVRHAHPTTLKISLEYRKNMVRLLIADDGSGFLQEDEVLGGFGVLGMRKRAIGISARFEICANLGEGTQVSVTTPLPPRVTFASWPVFLWKFLREHTRNGTPAVKSRPHSYSR
jgi:signal transduction histidine kinase